MSHHTTCAYDTKHVREKSNECLKRAALISLINIFSYRETSHISISLKFVQDNDSDDEDGEDEGQQYGNEEVTFSILLLILRNYCPNIIFAIEVHVMFLIFSYLKKNTLKVEYKLEMAHGYVKKGEEPRFNYDQYCDCH